MSYQQEIKFSGTIITLRWEDFKAMIAAKQLNVQFVVTTTGYTIFGLDAPVTYVCDLISPDHSSGWTWPFADGYTQEQSDTDFADFEDNFKSNCNKPLSPRSVDGVPVTVLDTPKESDKKMVVTISPATEGWKTWITGAGDNLTAVSGSGRGEGTPLVLNFTGSAVMDAVFEFKEPVEVHDGQICWKPVSNWTADDKFSVGVKIEATVATLTGSGGNCVVVPTGLGYNVIIPYPGGPYVVDLSQASPIPAPDKDGYWDVDYDSGEVTPSSKPGEAAYHLLDVPQQAWLLKRVSMGNPLGTFDIDAYKTEYLHPKWKLCWLIEKTSDGVGSVSGWIFVFRRFTF